MGRSATRLGPEASPGAAVQPLSYGHGAVTPLRYRESMRLLLLAAVLALPASAALLPAAGPVLPPPPAAAAAKTPVKKKAVRRKNRLFLKKSPPKRLKVVTRASASVAPATKEILPVPHPALKPVAVPDLGKAATSAKLVLGGEKSSAKKAASKAAPKTGPRAAPAAASTAAKKSDAKKDLSAPAPAKPAGFKPAGPTSVKLGEPRVARGKASSAPASRPVKTRRASSAGSEGGGSGGGGGRGGGGGSRGGGMKKTSIKKSSAGAKRAGGSGGGAPAKSAPAKKAAAPARAGGVAAQTPPAPPALPMVVENGAKRLDRPAAVEPAVSTIAVAGRKAYVNDVALWLAKADGRPAPALLVDGVWRFYEVSGGTAAASVTLRPAFPGMFSGRPDDPNLVYHADPAAGWIVRVEGTRMSGSLWADAAKPRFAGNLGERVSGAAFSRDGKSLVVKRLDGVETRSLPGGI